MGVVYTVQELLSGRVPRAELYPQAIELLRQELPELPGFLGAVICGSAVFGHQNIRSDLDVLVLYTEEARVAMWGELARIKARIAADFHISVDFAQLTPEMAGGWQHDISTSFECHLRNSVAQGGLIGEDPFRQILLARHKTMEPEPMNWLRQKVRMIDEGAISVYTDEREVHYLQRLLESPVHAMRKLLLHTEAFCDDSKQAVMLLVTERYPELADDLAHLDSMNQVYTEMLIECLESDDVARYGDILRLIRSRQHEFRAFLVAVGDELMAKAA